MPQSERDERDERDERERTAEQLLQVAHTLLEQEQPGAEGVWSVCRRAADLLTVGSGEGGLREALEDWLPGWLPWLRNTGLLSLVTDRGSKRAAAVALDHKLRRLAGQLEYALASTTERPEHHTDERFSNHYPLVGRDQHTACTANDCKCGCAACSAHRYSLSQAERPEPETGEPEPDAWLVEWKGTIHSAREDRPPHDLFTEPDWNIVPVYRQPTPERVAQIQAHRACLGTEHDPENGKMHGCCVVCGVPWPCEYVGQPPADSGEGGLREALERIKRLADSRDDSTVLFWDAVKIARNALASTTERPEPDDEEEKDDAEV